MADVIKMPQPNDPFDPENLRLDQNFAETAGVEKLLRTVPVKKPHRQSLIRVHPSPDYRLQTAIIELHEERETYLVCPEVAHQETAEVTPVTIYTAITRPGVVFLWPVKQPTPDGKIIEWHRSAREAAEDAMSHWIFVRPNMALGAYEIVRAPATIPDPVWPTKTLKALLTIGFREKLINNLNHPVLQRLRGET